MVATMRGCVAAAVGNISTWTDRNGNLSIPPRERTVDVLVTDYDKRDAVQCNQQQNDPNSETHHPSFSRHTRAIVLRKNILVKHRLCSNIRDVVQ